MTTRKGKRSTLSIHRMRHGAHQMLLRAVRLGLQQGAVGIDSNRCKGCGLCVATCPASTLRLSDGVNARGFHFSEQMAEKACIGCASCALVCPDACISVYRTGLINSKRI